LALAIATAAIGLAELVYFSSGYLPRQWGPILLWASLPPLAAYAVATLFVRSTPAAAIICVGLGMALALGAWGIWDVTLGPGRDESLSGLIVIAMPAYQSVILVISLLTAWITERRFRSASSRAPM
jgi:hypothetical protein